ncbi:MAG TPA: amidohydrolase family protein [Candidatus Acidoferrales bacterium]|nr:amidohydrolase family protein [Candidatus Acidoferrales bacterium]
MAQAESVAVDIHHHYIPAALIDEARRSGKTLGVEVVDDGRNEIGLRYAGGPPHGTNRDLMDVDRRLAMMDDCKIAVAAAAPHTAALAYGLDGAQGESWCRLYNEGFRELVNEHAARFAGVAAAPLQDPPRAARVLEHAVRDLGLCGVLIGSNVRGRYYDSEFFDPFWNKAQELDVLVIMHPEDVAGGERMGPYGLRTICGNPADSTLSIGYMAYGGVFDRFPNLKLCVLHGGGFFPYHLGRFDQGFEVRRGTRAAQSSSPPSAYLKNLYFDTLVYRADTLAYLRRLVGSARLMIGTDYPFTLGDWKAVEKVEALDCAQADKDAILFENARRLLKLPARSG